MSSKKRDDFSLAVRWRLAMRAGCRCSFPGCPSVTAGPSGEAADALNISGRAAHIHAAARGGPRYLESMTKAQRKSIENAIWMCAAHASIIDKDEDRYQPDLLRTMKADHEEAVRRSHEAGFWSPLLGHNRGNDVIVFDFLRQTLPPEMVVFQTTDRHPDPRNLMVDQNTYVSASFIEALATFVETIDVMLGRHPVSLESRSAIGEFTILCRDVLTVIDEADTDPPEPLRLQADRALARGDFFYVVDTDTRPDPFMAGADVISYQLWTFKGALIALAMSYNKLIHTINHQNLYPHPVPYLLSPNWPLLPDPSQSYGGLDHIRAISLNWVRQGVSALD